MNLLWQIAAWFGVGAATSGAYLDDFMWVGPVGRFIAVNAVGFMRVAPVGRFTQVGEVGCFIRVGPIGRFTEVDR